MGILMGKSCRANHVLTTRACTEIGYDHRFKFLMSFLLCSGTKNFARIIIFKEAIIFS